MADYTKVIADIKEHITTNGQRAITGKVLQDVLVEMTEAAQLGDEELQAVLAALTELVEDNQTDIANLPTDADVERVAQEEATRAKNEAITNSMAYTNGVTQDKSTWVQIRQITMTGGSGSLSVLPNVFYWVLGKVTSMSLSVFTTENTQNVLEMSSYAVQFTTDSTVGSFAFPSWWIFPSEPTIEPNKTYQITCVNGYALITAW